MRFRIDAAGKKGTQGDVRDHAQADRLAQTGEELL
jgi:hypothetical protein